MITEAGVPGALDLALKASRKPEGFKIQPGDEDRHIDMQCLINLGVAYVRTRKGIRKFRIYKKLTM